MSGRRGEWSRTGCEQVPTIERRYAGYAPCGGILHRRPLPVKAKTSRAAVGGAGLDSQSPPVVFVAKGGIPTKPAYAGFPVVGGGGAPRKGEAAAEGAGWARVRPTPKNASHRETHFVFLAGERAAGIFPGLRVE